MHLKLHFGSYEFSQSKTRCNNKSLNPNYPCHTTKSYRLLKSILTITPIAGEVVMFGLLTIIIMSLVVVCLLVLQRLMMMPWKQLCHWLDKPEFFGCKMVVRFFGCGKIK